MGVEPEKAMIAEARAGSELAWRQLFELHFDAVYRFCLALTAGRRELAEETSQQTFVAAARRIVCFDPRQGSFGAWLLGIARNRYMTLETKERRRRRRQLSPRDEEICSKAGSEPDLGVHEALARLPSDYRQALEDKYLRQLTMKEMAEANGGSIEAIESLLRRARDRFASVYEQIRNEK
ncbi:MAG: RNA polymerase sigma factor [Phycisphaerales bacterium]